MRRTPQKWYNMQYIDMSGKLPMGIAGNPLRARYSAAYPTGAERIVKGAFYHGNDFAGRSMKEKPWM